MYSFAQRDDVRVVDEPLYGHYLHVSGAEHPGREEIVSAMNCDGDAVMRDLIEQSTKSADTTLFIKHMAHHLLRIDLRFLERCSNIFLIRDPREMLPSLTVQLPHATLDDTGLKKQWQLLQDLRSNGQQTIVLDSRELLLDPEAVLRQLCNKLDLTFEEGMLRWRAGPRSEDGIWAKHWYQAVHKSTGFGEYVAKDDFPAKLRPLLDECRPYYENLYAQAIRARFSEETQT
jgi:hypothetical protein